MARTAPLSRRFYRRDAVTVARALLGQRLVRVCHGGRVAGIIVETEAYLGVADKAAHTCNGRRTPRNKSMWGDGGHAYVYFTYGLHHCVNIVAGRAGDPVAVLLRALEPVEGLDIMYTRRTGARRDRDLCSGPAKLAKALAIDRELDGLDLTGDAAMYVERARRRPVPADQIIAAPRIGIDYAGVWAHRRLRFYLRDNPYISRR